MKQFGSTRMAALALMACAGWLVTAAHAADDATSKNIIEYYRRKANVPPSAQLEVKDLKPSNIKGAKSGVLSMGARQIHFLVSDDGRYVVFGEVEDLTADPFAGVMKKISLKDAPFKGGKDAKVTIVEYSDFQCPFCSRGYQTMENQVLKEYGDKVRFTYKNFPLPMHPWAEPAAVAAECALEQKPKAFWKLYDFYFQNQREITPQNVKDKSLEALKDEGIDTAKFTDCFDNKKTLSKVKEQQAEGSSVGVNGTPAFIINGRLVSGAQPFDNFKAVIDDELARADNKK
jgi:protein-disulfide isomerase